MKKLVILLLACFTSVVYAYEIDLSTAIKNSDLGSVKFILSDRTLTSKEKVKYLDLAQNVIVKRRDDLYFNVTTAGSKKYHNMGLFSLVLSTIPNAAMPFFCIYDKKELAQIGLCISMGSLILSLPFFIKAKQIENREKSELYNNALAIKELLFGA